MPAYVNPNFQQSNSPQHFGNSAVSRMSLSDKIQIFLGVIGIILTFVFSYWGITLTKKYGDSQAQINELDTLSRQIAVFIDSQTVTNKRLYSLDSTTRLEYNALKGIVQQSQAQTLIQAWEPLNRLSEMRESFLESIRNIQTHMYIITDSSGTYKNADYSSHLSQIHNWLKKEMSSQILFLEGYRNNWFWAYDVTTNALHSASRSDSLISITQDNARKDYLLGIKRMNIQNSLLQSPVWKLIKKMPDYKLPKTDLFLERLQKLEVIEFKEAK